MELLYLFVGLALGIIIGVLLFKLRARMVDTSFEDRGMTSREDEEKLKTLEENKLKLSIENGELKKEIFLLTASFDKITAEQVDLREQYQQSLERASSSEAQRNALEKALVNQKEELLEVQEKFSKEFELIANKILDAKTEKFSEQNEKRLGEILTPFQTNIKDFKQTVENTYHKGLKERSELSKEIQLLTQLNKGMREDAQNLTNALKQDSKAQGNWGEIVLERVLESSGLTKGREYEMQFSTTNDDGKRVQPDVIVHLPEEKDVIIDAKVSLKAYNELINAEDNDVREKHLKMHLLSIKNHINGLAEKNYQSAYGIQSPDFVLLFLPIESSFSIASQADNELFNYAWSRKIVIVSPSTLLATLRTIESIWKQEYRNKNIEEIARQAGNLYDKFVGFVEDMQKIEKNLQGVEGAFQGAMNKLSTGKGNLANSVEKIKKLGIKTKKEIPNQYLDVVNE